ncbi:MAG: hypothetical protein L3J91_00085 [Thermoplasmata archaeon]|nr:hypothetical protein [Thermoplasmata archaeon]
MKTRVFLLLLVLAGGAIASVAVVGSTSASTVQPVQPTTSGCTPGGLFGHVAPDGNALVGILYPDPATGAECVLQDHQTLAGSTVQIWIYTPDSPPNNTVAIGVEEYTPSVRQIPVLGPNGTTVYVPVLVRTNAVWSNATVSAIAGEFQQFNLQIPPVFVAPSQAYNLTFTILGLDLEYLIATPGTSLVVPVTVGGLIGWLAAMSPIAVVTFVAGFGPGEWFVHRLRYISTGKYAAGFALVVSVSIGIGIAGDFTGFLYWLGQVGIAGLALLLLLPLFVWGCAFWVTVRGKRLRSRVIRSPIAKAVNGEPVVGATQVKIYGGGQTGHEEELVEGLGVGGPKAAWYRMLGCRVRWHPNKIARDPRFIHWDWEKGRLDIEGEYAAWPTADGKRLDWTSQPASAVWFPWRKAVKERFDAKPGEVVDPGNDGVKDPTLWAHRGFFLGLRHGEATLAALGTPDYVGPDQYVRGVAPAAAFGRESQRRGTALVLLNEQIGAEAEDLAWKLTTVHDRMQSFPGSPEAMEGLREISTRVMRRLYDPEDYLRRLEDRGKLRADYRPPGAKTYTTSSSEVAIEVQESLPPDLRGKQLRRGQRAS